MPLNYFMIFINAKVYFLLLISGLFWLFMRWTAMDALFSLLGLSLLEKLPSCYS